MSSFYASSESNEWYTPAKYIELVTRVLQGIDLDPCSSDAANETVCATRYWTINDDAFTRRWKARSVFCNPPYGRIEGRSAQGYVLDYMADEYRLGNFDQGILLTNCGVGDAWFQPVWEVADAVCLVHRRIRYECVIEGRRYMAPSPTKGNAFTYFGNRVPEFHAIFSEVGYVVRT